MNEFALGWDIHRKFSKVSLQEMTTEGQAQGRPISSWTPGDARVAPLRCPILRLRRE